MDKKCLDQYLVLSRCSINMRTLSFPLLLLPKKHLLLHFRDARGSRHLQHYSIFLLSQYTIAIIRGLLRNNRIVFVWAHQRSRINKR